MTVSSRHLKWALEQVGERDSDDRDDLGRSFDFIDSATDLPDVLVSARSRRSLI
jgi:hypothetical protein